MRLHQRLCYIRTARYQRSTGWPAPCQRRCGSSGKMLAARYGIFVPLTGLTVPDAVMLAGIVVAALAMGLLPAWRAYRNTLADGLTIRT